MLRDLVALVFPLACPGCGRPAEPVCDACAARLRPAPPAPAPPPLGAWAAAFAYEGVARELVARVKYRRAHAPTAWLAAAMVAPALGITDRRTPLVVTWAPTTARRRRARGFDHAELLARRLAGRMRVPVRGLLTRAPGVPQTGLAATARRAGPVFLVRGAVPPAVLVVDDVATTGGTLAAAATALRGAGAASVVAVTAARTPGRAGGP